MVAAVCESGDWILIISPNGASSPAEFMRLISTVGCGASGLVMGPWPVRSQVRERAG